MNFLAADHADERGSRRFSHGGLTGNQRDPRKSVVRNFALCHIL